jgi:type VI protein secretion system component Hcp
MYLTLFGVGGASAAHPNQGKIELDSVVWGFDLTPGADTFEYNPPIVPSTVVVAFPSIAESPELMGRFLDRSVLKKGFIRATQRDRAGKEVVVATVTLHDVHVVEFGQHADGDEFTDTAQLTFSALEYVYPPGPTAAFSFSNA